MGNTCKIIDFNSDENEIETITFEKKVIIKTLIFQC